MDMRYRLLALLLFTASACTGCVTVHAPLVPDKDYPLNWGELSTLGPECRSLEGIYLNAGVVADIDGKAQSMLLTSALNILSEARLVSLYVRIRKIDQNGDAFITLLASPDDDPAASLELEGCFCIKGTLACTQVYEKYWSVPNFGLGGSQRNVYFSRSGDRSLIAKLQNYHADIMLGIPIFGMKEPWARFEAADR